MKTKIWLNCLLVVLLSVLVIPVALANNVSSYTQLVEALKAHAPLESSFTVNADRSYNFMKNKSDVSDAITEAGIATCSYSIAGDGRSLTLSKVEWYPNPQSCHSITDAETILQKMAVQGTDTFTLICDTNTCTQLMADNARLLEKIAGQSGARLSSFRYSDRCISLEGVQYLNTCQPCSTLDDVKAFFVEQTARLNDTFTLLCDTALYSRLVANHGNLMYQLLQQCGVRNIQFSYSEASGMITLQDLHYYPGFRIARLYQMSRTAELTANEKQTLDAALEIVNQCAVQGQDPLLTEKNLHDAICDRITYQASYTRSESDQDTAIGGLLYGQADCDGYADTFYLLASLAGFDVNYQQGNKNPSYQDDLSPQDIGHMWNRIRLGEDWYQVDVTWDDDDRPDGRIRYCWFNSALDIASETHIWDPETDLYPLARTTPDPLYYYTSPMLSGPAFFQSVSDLVGEMITIAPGEEKTLSVMVNTPALTHEELVKAFEDTIKRRNIYGPFSLSDTINCIGTRSFVTVTFSR